MIRTLSCHCGAVRLEVNAELDSVTECNCSTCSRWGMLNWKVLQFDGKSQVPGGSVPPLVETYSNQSADA